MNCEQGHDQDIAGKYVAGALSSDETAAFEQHYFECDACLAAVEFGQALKYGAATGSAKVIAMPSRAATAPRQRWHWAYAAIAAAAVVAVTLVGWRAVKPTHTQTGTAVNSPAPVSPVLTPSEPVQPQLVASNAGAQAGAIEPMAYRPAVLRGTSDDAAERFRKTMTAYQARDYRKAAIALASIPVAVPGSGKPEEHITDAGIQLYLGISRLMINDDADAVVALRRAVAYGDTPYLENAGFYLAKGLIRQRQYAEAAAQLRQTLALNGDRQRDARQLLDQVNQLQAK
jgi:anti-sigma factor RsiW